MVLQFRARSRCDAGVTDPDSARAVLNRWVRGAGAYGWFIVEPTPRGRRPGRKIAVRRDPAGFTIGHCAVDHDGIFQLNPEFDGWSRLSRRGELLVFDTLAEALDSICPSTIAA